VLLAIGIVAQQVYVVFSLYLALTLGVIVMLQRTRDIVLISAGLGIPLVIAGVQAWPFSSSGTRTSALWSVSDAMTLLLFVVAYLAMYVRQAQANRQVAEYAAQVEALTLLAERQRMARELHDTLAQGVVGLALQLETIDSLLDDAQAPRAQEIVRHALRRARTTLAAARGAIEGLRESREDVLAAVHDDIRAFTATTGIPCHAELESLALLSTPRQEQVAGTIVEALCNVERHARATQVWVRTTLQDGMLQVEVRDDGVGFDPDAIAAQPGHYGLRGLRERARLLDGQISVLSAPGEGTALRLSVPAREALPGVANGVQPGAAHGHRGRADEANAPREGANGGHDMAARVHE
jgi:two-component system, NarL family, sensor histidine kinase YdfH